MDVDQRLIPSLNGGGQSLTEAVLQTIPDAAVIVDDGVVVTALNEAFEELCGTHRSQILQRSLWTWLPGLSEAMKAAIEAGCAWEAKVELAAGGRDVTPFKLRLRPFFDDTGSLTNWIVIVSPDTSVEDAASLGVESLDTLTNLPTFALVRERLRGLLTPATAIPANVIVYCIDLDNFDDVNRQHGRAVGDLVLVEMARRVGQRMRASNTVGRINEDMFVVVVHELTGTEQITAVATRLLGGIAQPFVVQGVSDPIILSACIGIAVSPENGTTADELLQNAQTAVDAAKRSATGTYQFYSNSSDVSARERRSRVNMLRRAIDDEQMFLQYQPKISIATGQVVGAEALVRWQDPTSGIVMPADFIPLAEDAGLIESLGEKVLREACQTWLKWRAAGCPYIRVAVNVSARQIARRGFLNKLKSILHESEVPPDALELEITESSVMEQAESVIQRLRLIREMGIHLSADDFGTGYASLSYLRDFPIDGIKIDTTFVADIEDPEDGGGLAAGIIAVGHSLGMRVVAEGVETEHQLSFLRWHACDEVQGFLVSPPLDADDFLQLVKGGRVI